MSVLDVEISDFSWASHTLTYGAGDPVGDALTILAGRLQDSGGMAGTDPAGAAWAREYDRAARQALRSGQDGANGCYRLAAMFARSAQNYGQADLASTAGVRRQVIDTMGVLSPEPMVVSIPIGIPDAAGAQPRSLGDYGAAVLGPVLAAIGVVVPNGHQDRLRAAAQAWLQAAVKLADAAESARCAPVEFTDDRLPEAGDMRTVCAGMADHLHELAHVFRALAQSCDDYAQQLDLAHQQIESELRDLAAQTAAIEAGSALLSVVTFGGSELAGNAVEAGRVAAAVGRVRQIVLALIDAMRAVTASIRAVAERVDRVAGALAGVLEGPLTTAIVRGVAALPAGVRLRELVAISRLDKISEGLPSLIFRGNQIEKKFKHAQAFGVPTRRGRVGFGQFERTLDDFVSAPGTVRLSAARARYNKEPVIISYNPKTRLVVIQEVTGEFKSGWRMTPEAMYYLRKFGTLGGQK